MNNEAPGSLMQPGASWWILQMDLASQLVKFFHTNIDAGEIKCIGDFSLSDPMFLENLDMHKVVTACNRLHDEGYLMQILYDPLKGIMGRYYGSTSYSQRASEYGEYDFVVNGFKKIRERLCRSVLPVIVEKENGNEDIGTCFLAGNNHTIFTARHVVENMRRILIPSQEGIPINVNSVYFPKDQNEDLAMVVTCGDYFKSIQPIRFSDPDMMTFCASAIHLYQAFLTYKYATYQ